MDGTHITEGPHTSGGDVDKLMATRRRYAGWGKFLLKMEPVFQFLNSNIIGSYNF